jgi:hypothetical protein
MKWVDMGDVHMGERRIGYRLLVGKPEAKKNILRPKRRWNNIKIDL